MNPDKLARLEAETAKMIRHMERLADQLKDNGNTNDWIEGALKPVKDILNEK